MSEDVENYSGVGKRVSKRKNLLFKTYLKESKWDFQRRAKLRPINLALAFGFGKNHRKFRR